MSHTKEPPWSVALVQVGKEWLKGRLTEAVVSGDEIKSLCGDDVETCRRIVACVNACAGFTTEALENKDVINHLKRLRDELFFNSYNEIEVKHSTTTKETK